NLNPNADWVNGTTVVGQITSQDVKFTFEAMIQNSSLDPYGIGPDIEAIMTPNNTTVTFLFDKQSALFLPFVATQVIIPSAWAKYDNGKPGNIGSYNNMAPFGEEITAGPFILKSVSSAGATLVANTHFWMGTPNVETILIEEFKSTAASTLALTTGEIGAEIPSLSDYNSLVGAANITNVNQVEPYTFYLWVNDTVAPYNNSNFRQGLAYAINKTQIMTKAEDGLGSWGMGNFSFGGLPYVLKSDWAPGLTYYQYNKTMAIKEFEKAGYHFDASTGYIVNNTTLKPVKMTIMEPPVSDWEAAGTFIQADLQAAGIDATLSDVPFSTWGADVFSSAFQNITTYFGYVPPFTNPYLQLQEIYGYKGGWNFESFNNKEMNTLLNESINQTGSAFTNSLDQMQQIVDQQVPVIPIGNANSYYAYNNKVVSGFLANLSVDNPYNFMHIVSYYTPPSPTSPNYTIYYIIAGVVIVVAVVASVAAVVMRRRGGGREEK
ncbi:MAG TPA: ABC transporter substrate-binding protein, partial [Thermoplasmataceae archaeon]|nr:ABC transporter substrate-binding protein [Thermoplasmataceae archaeon]